MGQTPGGNSRHLSTKSCGLGSLKRTNSLCKKSPTQKSAFEWQCPSPVIVRFGDFRDFQTFWPWHPWHSHSFVASPKSKACLYHYSHVCGSGRGMPCTQVLATKPCRCQANIGYKASPWPEVKIPKVDNIWDVHCPSKVPFCVGDFLHKLFVRFRESSPHGFVLKRHEFPSRVRPISGKPLDSVPHRQEMRPTYAL